MAPSKKVQNYILISLPYSAKESIMGLRKIPPYFMKDDVSKFIGTEIDRNASTRYSSLFL